MCMVTCVTVVPQNNALCNFIMLQFPSTSCPGVAGFVSCKAMSSVFICRVKLLPLTVTMVIVPPGSVACRGASKTSLDSTLWECNGTCFESKLGAQQPCKCIHWLWLHAPSLASFPCSAQLSIACSMEKRGEPGIFSHMSMMYSENHENLQN